jgi:hypothetical protein
VESSGPGEGLGGASAIGTDNRSGAYKILCSPERSAEILSLYIEDKRDGTRQTCSPERSAEILRDQSWRLRTPSGLLILLDYMVGQTIRWGWY